MTQHQINYWNYDETKRHNRAVEDETKRNNIVVSNEVTRHNLVTEGETQRHNVVTEGESARHNRATEGLQHESNVIQNSHFQRMDAEQVRNNRENNAISWYNASTQRDMTDSNIERNRVQNVTDNYRADVYATEKALNKAREDNVKADTEVKKSQRFKNYVDAQSIAANTMYLPAYVMNDALRSFGSLLGGTANALKTGVSILGPAASGVSAIKSQIVPIFK